MPEYVRNPSSDSTERVSIKGEQGGCSPTGRRQGRLTMTFYTGYTNGPEKSHEDREGGIKAGNVSTSGSGTAAQASQPPRLSTPQVGNASQQLPSQLEPHGSSTTEDNSETTQEELEDPQQRKYRRRRLRIAGINGNSIDHTPKEPPSYDGSSKSSSSMDSCRRSLGERHQSSSMRRSDVSSA